MEKLLGRIGKQSKMGRRDFIGHSLALSAAATLSPVSSSMATAAGTKAAWLSHYTYVAPDLAETRDWYHEVFGMQIGRQDATEAHLWYGDEGGDTLMIVRQAGAGEKAPRIDRFGFILDDWDRNAVGAELRRRAGGVVLAVFGRRPAAGVDRMGQAIDMQALGASRFVWT